jgi:peptidoglycan-associated lipoprotein
MHKNLKIAIKKIKSSLFLFGVLLTACNETGKVEHYINEDNDSKIKVSEMLLIEKTPEESSKQKEFVKNVQKDRIYFKFDQHDICDQDKKYLEKIAEYLMLNKNLQVEVQGNCDKRGSIDYNNALGMKRAHSIVGFLKHKGINQERIKSVSFGSRIIEEGDNEEAYEKNRVAIIIIQ